MDKTECYSSKEAMQDSTRELLIAISYGMPDTDPTGAARADGDEKVDSRGSDSEGKLRSDLICISYSSSPEGDGKAELLPLPS